MSIDVYTLIFMYKVKEYRLCIYIEYVMATVTSNYLYGDGDDD